MDRTASMTQSVRARSLVLLLGALFGCDSATPNGNLGPGCGTSTCDNGLWPRLVVAQTTPVDAGVDAGLPDVQVTAVIDGVVMPPPMLSGCPLDITVIDCQFMFWCSPSTTQITLRVKVGGQPPVEKVIPMRSFNYCGNDLAYVHFGLVGDPAMPVIGEPEYVSPCRIPH
jgi:hypothetical protein